MLWSRASLRLCTRCDRSDGCWAHGPRPALGNAGGRSGGLKGRFGWGIREQMQEEKGMGADGKSWGRKKEEEEDAGGDRK